MACHGRGSCPIDLPVKGGKQNSEDLQLLYMNRCQQRQGMITHVRDAFVARTTCCSSLLCLAESPKLLTGKRS